MDPIEKRFVNTGRSKTFRNIVRTFDLDTKAVLDIGCSYGEFLAHFGPGSTGITIAEEEAVYGKQRGLDIRCGNIEDKQFTLDQKYDVVFANNIFEHLYSPHGFLHKTRDYLKTGGLLILGVPCIPKIASLVHLQKFRGSLAEAHINFFTRETLIKTVERAGYEIGAVRGFHFSNTLVDHLLDPIYPHFYVAAKPIEEFSYTEKRQKELAGYTEHTL
jgi:SAM-dependent methyltransferase